MSKYLLGLDNGNTVSKVAIFDLNGKEIEVASCNMPTEYPQDGWTERSMHGLWQGASQAIQEVLNKSGISASDIIAIGCSGHGNGIYLLDKNGAPLRAGIQSLDSRGSSIAEKWLADGLHAQIHPYTLQAIWAAQPSVLLAWLKANEPDNYNNVSAVLMCKDYINYCLTGEICSDYTDMSGTSLLDVQQKTYSEELLALYGIKEIYSALPRLVKSHEVIGQVTAAAASATGLQAGIPVVGGLFDVDASAIGAGINKPGQACIIAGTWSINEVVTSKPIIDDKLFMTSIFADGDSFLTLEASATSATNLEWFVQQFCDEERRVAQANGQSVYDVCSDKVASIAPQDSNIIFHPFLYGSNVQANARAGFYGVAGWHSKAHLLRALFEGVVFSHLNHIEKLRESGADFSVARLTGGGARSETWSQIFADTLQTPIEIPDGIENGARGAAIAAGIGAGVYDSYQQASDNAVQLLRRHEPDANNTEIYLARYEEYKKLIAAMQEPWNRMA